MDLIKKLYEKVYNLPSTYIGFYNIKLIETAVRYSDLNIIRYLFEANKKAIVQPRNLNNTLMYSITHGYPAISNYLTEHVVVNQSNTINMIFNLCVAYDRTEIIEYITVHHDINLKPYIYKLIYKSIVVSAVKTILYLVRKAKQIGFNIHCEEEYLLRFCIAQGRIDAIYAIINMSLLNNVIDVLYISVTVGNLFVVRYFIEKYGNIFGAVEYEHALKITLIHQHPDVIKYLQDRLRKCKDITKLSKPL